MSKLERVVLYDAGSAIVVHEESWPIVTSTWFGPATEPLVVGYFARTDGHVSLAKARGERFAMITDTYATAPPPAKVRQRIAELSGTHGPRAKPYVVGSFTVIENPLIRGVVTALSWIDSTMADTTNVGSYEAALAAAIAALSRAGIEAPAQLPTRQADPRRASRTG